MRIANYTELGTDKKEFAVNVWVDAEPRLIEGSGICWSCSRRPISMNSFLEGLRHMKFEVIQEDIWVATWRR